MNISRKLPRALFVTLAFVLLSRVGPSAENDLYALSLLQKYPESGTTAPPDICEREVRNPCVLRRSVMYMPVLKQGTAAGNADPRRMPLSTLETLREKLSPQAWSALQRPAADAQEIWVFNVCMDKMPQYPNCFALHGVATLNKTRVTFYAFFKRGVYAGP